MTRRTRRVRWRRTVRSAAAGLRRARRWLVKGDGRNFAEGFEELRRAEVLLRKLMAAADQEGR